MANKCLCTAGVVSKCTANSREDELICKFEEKSTWDNRCRYRIEERDNHCDHEAAQRYARELLHGDELHITEEDELEINLEEFDFEKEIDVEILSMITTCGACENLNTTLSRACTPQPQDVEETLRLRASVCPNFTITATCVICKKHQMCHNGSSLNELGFQDKIDIAQTCKQYDPVTGGKCGYN